MSDVGWGATPLVAKLLAFNKLLVIINYQNFLQHLIDFPRVGIT
jgi:hypothetical protein